MALYSMHIEHEGGSFSMQLADVSAKEAVRSFFLHPIAQSVLPVLTSEDIMYVVPMTGLVNIWAACAGKDGRYVSITVVRTVEDQGG